MTERRRKVSTQTEQDRVVLTEQQVARLIEMYQAENADGSPKYTTAQMTQELRVPRGTIYWTLMAAGIIPKRLRRTPSQKPTVEQLLRENNVLRDRISELETECDKLSRQLTRVMRLLAGMREAEGKGTKTRPTKGGSV